MLAPFLLIATLALDVAAAAPLDVERLEGPYASIEAFCAMNAPRQKQADHFESCTCVPDQKAPLTTGPATTSFGEVRTFRTICEDHDRRLTHAGLAVKIGKGWWAAASDVFAFERSGMSAVLSTDVVERRTLGKADALLWRVHEHDTTPLPQGDSYEVDAVSLVIVSSGASKRLLATHSITLTMQERWKVTGNKRMDVVLEPQFDAAGTTLTVTGRIEGVDDGFKARLGATRALTFP
jgi:hypothetical protein